MLKCYFSGSVFWLLAAGGVMLLDAQAYRYIVQIRLWFNEGVKGVGI
jgi:hypothetical protein